MEHIDIAIIGAGIAGLTAAYRISQNTPGVRWVVFESAPVTGGLLGSARVADRTVDTAADAFLARVHGAVDLAVELGLGDDLVAPSTGQATVVVNGRLRQLPAGLVLGVPTDLDALAASSIVSPEGLRIAAQDLTTDRPFAGTADRSVAEAVGSHLGSEVVQRLVDPLLGGISAANSDQLSVNAVSPLIAAAAREPRLMAALIDQQASAARGQIGVTEQRPVFLAPRRGIHQLVTALTAQVADHVRSTNAVRSVHRHEDRWILETVTGPVSAARVIAATPAYVTAALFDDAARQAPDIATMVARLRVIRYASVALVVLAYRSADAHLPSGSGMLVPRIENRFVTAASWWDQKWPHLRSDEHVLIRASVGRIDDVRFKSLTDTELVAAVHTDLASIGGVHLTAQPVDTHVGRWVDSFAQYDVGHEARIDALRTTLPAGIYLAGAALRGVGLPACIRGAGEAARQVIESLE